jgi:hypothetical protein
MVRRVCQVRDHRLKFSLLPARAYCTGPRKVGRQPVHEAEKLEKRRSPLFCKTKTIASHSPVRATAGVAFIDENGGGPGDRLGKGQQKKG